MKLPILIVCTIIHYLNYLFILGVYWLYKHLLQRYKFDLTKDDLGELWQKHGKIK